MRRGRAASPYSPDPMRHWRRKAATAFRRHIPRLVRASGWRRSSMANDGHGRYRRACSGVTLARPKGSKASAARRAAVLANGRWIGADRLGAARMPPQPCPPGPRPEPARRGREPRTKTSSSLARPARSASRASGICMPRCAPVESRQHHLARPLPRAGRPPSSAGTGFSSGSGRLLLGPRRARPRSALPPRFSPRSQSRCSAWPWVKNPPNRRISTA